MSRHRALAAICSALALEACGPAEVRLAGGADPSLPPSPGQATALQLPRPTPNG